MRACYVYAFAFASVVIDVAADLLGDQATEDLPSSEPDRGHGMDPDG